MKNVSIGRLILFIGMLIVCIGLICNGFEIVSVTQFRIIVLVGVIAEIIAIIFILKKGEF